MKEETVAGGVLMFSDAKKQALLKKLAECRKDSEGDAKCAHKQADGLLLEYIGDGEIMQAFLKIKRWYA